MVSSFDLPAETRPAPNQSVDSPFPLLSLPSELVEQVIRNWIPVWTSPDVRHSAARDFAALSISPAITDLITHTMHRETKVALDMRQFFPEDYLPPYETCSSVAPLTTQRAWKALATYSHFFLHLDVCWGRVENFVREAEEVVGTMTRRPDTNGKLKIHIGLDDPANTLEDPKKLAQVVKMINVFIAAERLEVSVGYWSAEGLPQVLQQLCNDNNVRTYNWNNPDSADIIPPPLW